MTKRLYFSDPYAHQFDGEIVNRIDTPEGPAVIMRETYFYPDSGGQPHDLGTIDGIPLVRVLEQGEDVLHILSRAPASERVSCRIDTKRRRDHMQQHSGQHILSAASLKEAGAQTLSFHLGNATSTIDLQCATLEPAMLARVEREANHVVRQSLSIRSYFIKSEEAVRLNLRKAPEVEGILRVVDIEGFDRQACCGTHPKNTAEVGPIVVRGTERFKGGTRVEFVCGDRALGDHKTSIHRIRSLTRVLNSPEEKLVDTAAQMVEQKKELAKSLQALREETLQMKAEGWLREAAKLPDYSLVVREVSGVTSAELRLLAIYLTKKPSRVALLGTRAQGRAHLVFGRSANAPALDMAALLRRSLTPVEGNGGGSAQIAQGGGPRIEGLTQALEGAKQELVQESSNLGTHDSE